MYMVELVFPPNSAEAEHFEKAYQAILFQGKLRKEERKTFSYGEMFVCVRLTVSIIEIISACHMLALDTSLGKDRSLLCILTDKSFVF